MGAQKSCKLTLASPQNYALVSHAVSETICCSLISVSTVYADDCLEPLEGTFDGTFLELCDGHVMQVKFQHRMNASGGNPVCFLKVLRLGRTRMQARGRCFVLNDDGTLSPREVPTLVIALKPNGFVRGSLTDHVQMEQMPFTPSLVRDLLVLKVDNVARSLVLVGASMGSLYIYRIAAGHGAEAVAFVYMIAHPLVTPWEFMFWIKFQPALDFLCDEPVWNSKLIAKTTCIIGAYIVIWALAAWFAAVMMVHLDSDWLRNSTDHYICIFMCAVFYPPYSIAYNYFVFGLPLKNCCIDAIVKSALIQLQMHYLSFVYYCRFFVLTNASTSLLLQNIIVLAVSMFAILFKVLIDQCFRFFAQLSEDWRYDSTVQDRVIEVSDMVEYGCGFLTDIGAKLLVTAIPNVWNVFVVSCAMALVEFGLTKHMTNRLAQTTSGKTGTDLAIAKAHVSISVVRNLSQMQLEYIVIAQVVLAAYMFNHNSIINGFGGKAEWDIGTCISIICAQYIPEIFVDMLGLMFLARKCKIDVPRIYWLTRKNHSVFLWKILSANLLWTMVIPGALARTG